MLQYFFGAVWTLNPPRHGSFLVTSAVQCGVGWGRDTWVTPDYGHWRHWRAGSCSRGHYCGEWSIHIGIPITKPTQHPNRIILFIRWSTFNKSGKLCVWSTHQEGRWRVDNRYWVAQSWEEGWQENVRLENNFTRGPRLVLDWANWPV